MSADEEGATESTRAAPRPPHGARRAARRRVGRPRAGRRPLASPPAREMVARRAPAAPAGPRRLLRGAAALVCAVPPERAIWLLALLPVWILVAKLAGLYDADHRAMRHLTVDEAPAIVAWGVIGTVIVGLLGELTPAGGARRRRACDRGLGRDRRRHRAARRRARRLAGEHPARAGADRRKRRPRARDAPQARSVHRPPHGGGRAGRRSRGHRPRGARTRAHRRGRDRRDLRISAAPTRRS